MLNRSASLAMSTSVLKAESGKLDIKRNSPSILYIPGHTHLLFKNDLLMAWPGECLCLIFSALQHVKLNHKATLSVSANGK